MRTKKKLNRGLKVFIACAVAAGVIVGGVFAWYRVSQSRIVVNVISVQNVAMTWYQDQSTTYGTVSADVSQNVYVSDQDTVEEILVQEGQQVTVGTPLLVYDTTLLSLQSQAQELSIQIAQNDIKAKQAEVNAFKKKYASVLGNYNPLAPLAATAGQTGLPVKLLAAEVTETPSPSLSPDPSPEPTEAPLAPEPIRLLNKDSVPYAGAGTQGDPFRYFITSGATIASDFLVDYALREKTAPVYVALEMRAGNVFDGTLYCTWLMTFETDGGFSFQTILDSSLAPYDPYVPSPSPGESPSPEPSPSPSPSPTPAPTPPPGPGLTAAEIRQMYRDMVFALNGMQLDLRQKQIDHMTTAKLLESGTVNAKIDGTVTNLVDVETAQSNGIPLFSVSGGGGYYILGQLSEFDLDTITLGQEVGISDWNTGNQLTGTVVEIGDMPLQGSYYSGAGNMNVSYYPFKLYVPAGAGLVAGSGVSLSLSGAIQPGNQIFLDKPFIRQDTDGSAYVFVAGADGRLEQRPVTLGKLVYGTYYQILTGLSLDDNIAFAYDKNARAGVKTQVVDPNTFYGYY